MGDGENPEMSRGLEVHDVVRKPRDGSASNRQLWRHSRHQGVGPWHRHDAINRGINGVEEFKPEVRAPIFVPSTRKAVFGVRFVFKANVGVHWRRS